MIDELLYLVNGYFLLGNINNFSYYAAKLVKKQERKKETEKLYCDLYDPSFISVLIPAYDEADVIGRTIDNFMKIDYPRDEYEVVIATYESDYKTRDVVESRTKIYPNLREVVNPKKPPTTKAQNLNHAYQFIDKKTEIVGFHDAEDVVPNDTLRNANCLLKNGFDAVQFKVLPENRGKSLTERSYALTFSKYYNFIIPAKERLGRLITSAGVGTYLKKNVINEIRELDGYLFDEGNLTEDLELSIRLAERGYKIKYVDISSTREKFPTYFSKAVRQRSRWVLGGIQTLEKHGFGKKLNFNEKLGLMFEYLGLGTPLWGLAFGIGVTSIVGGVTNYIPQIITEGSPLWYLSIINTIGALEEILMTPYYSSKEYGGGIKEYIKDLPAVFVNDVINFVSASKAISKYIRSKLRKEAFKWDKTVRN
jgi:adsorption protein B